MFRYTPKQKQNSTPSYRVVHNTSYPNRRHTVPARQRTIDRNGLRWAIAAVVLVVLFIGYNVIFGRGPKPVDTQPGDAGQPISNSKQVQELDFSAMDKVINDTISSNTSMDIGVAVIDCKTGRLQDYGVKEPFVAASTAKLITALAFLYDVERGQASLEQKIGNKSAKQALEALIVDSDNQVWDIFNNTIMDHQELADYAASTGLTNYNPDDNTITPESVAKLLNNLYGGKLLNQEHTDLVLSFMERAREVEFITNAVPDNIKVYHKPGYLADRMHDAAIIDNGARPYVLVIFTKSRVQGYDAVQGEKIFTTITKATLDTFGR